jgi:hypothetical protein
MAGLRCGRMTRRLGVPVKATPVGSKRPLDREAEASAAGYTSSS